MDAMAKGSEHTSEEEVLENGSLLDNRAGIIAEIVAVVFR